MARPRPALLPAQSLLQVADTIFLTRPRGEDLHHLQPRQFRRRTQQREQFLVSFHPRQNDLDDNIMAQGAPAAQLLLPAHLTPLPVDEGMPRLPRSRPTLGIARLGQRWPPFPPAVVLLGQQRV